MDYKFYMLKMWLFWLLIASVLVYGKNLGNEETVRESLFTKADGEIVFGIDTELSKEEFIQFKKNYFECLDKLDWINEHGYRKDKNNIIQMYEEYFKRKINLNALDKLEELGWHPGLTDRGLQANILFRGGVILTGHTTDSVVSLDNLEKRIYGSLWEFKIDKFIKGKELMNEGDIEGSTIYLKSLLGSGNSNSGECRYLRNTNYLLFLYKSKSYPKENPPKPYRKVNFKCFAYEDEDVWTEDNYLQIEYKKDKRSKLKYNMTFSEIISLIKDIEVVNDTKNFYKRKYNVPDRRSINTPNVKDTFILDNIWPDQIKLKDISEKQFLELKSSYLNKCDNFGMSNEQGIRNSFWKYHINVNNLLGFKKLEILPDYKYPLDFNLNEQAFYSQAVIIGKVIDSKINKNEAQSSYKYNNTIQIEDILIGQAFLPTKTIQFHHRYKLIKDQAYCFFLSRLDFENTAKHNSKFSKRSVKLREQMSRFLPINVNDQDIFTYTIYSPPIKLEDLPEIYEKQFNEQFNLKMFKETLHQIDKLNDKGNFYKRSYD